MTRQVVGSAMKLNFYWCMYYVLLQFLLMTWTIVFLWKYLLPLSHKRAAHRTRETVQLWNRKHWTASPRHFGLQTAQIDIQRIMRFNVGGRTVYETKIWDLDHLKPSGGGLEMPETRHQWPGGSSVAPTSQSLCSCWRWPFRVPTLGIWGVLT